MPRLLLILLAVALSATPVTADPAAAPLSKIFARYDSYLDLADKETPAFAPIFIVQPKEGGLSGILFSFTYEEETVRFVSDARGVIAFRPTRAMLEADPLVTVNREKGTMGMGISLQVLITPATQYAMDDLHDRVHAAWKQAKSLGGMMSFLAPSHANILAFFDTDCADRRWSVEKDGAVLNSGEAPPPARIALKDKKIRKADTVRFSCAPTQFTLE